MKYLLAALLTLSGCSISPNKPAQYEWVEQEGYFILCMMDTDACDHDFIAFPRPDPEDLSEFI